MAKPKSYPENEEEPVVIKKYANRRLYNTDSSNYVTLDHLAQMVKEGRDFVVRDAKSGEDITRSVLTQIIFEQESRGETLLPIPFLRQLIQCYGEGMQAMVPGFLQASMDSFRQNQERISEYLENNLNPAQGMAVFDEMARHNIDMVEQAFRMFGAQSGVKDEPQDHADDQNGADDSDSIDEMRRHLTRMQEQIDKLSKK